ncbi:DNA-directed DNA polymerase II small subunit [Candidatus Woesearchaeota archaeon]|nr:DNA-directed DNA polymerase II small subunit [Candidatus Woesearchaeota archaeon]
MDRIQLISLLLKKGLLVSPETLEEIEKNFDEDIFSGFSSEEIEKSLVFQFNKHNLNEKKEDTKFSVEIIKSYSFEPKKREVSDFVNYFKARYNQIKEILHGRPELQNVISINRGLSKKKNDRVSIIGMISDKRITKNGNILLTLEDPTGQINVLITKNKSLSNLFDEIVFDEIVGVSGVVGDKILFADSLYFPELPLSKEFKKINDEVYAAFIGDIHIGSKMFLEEDFKKFIEWINCNYGNQNQKEVAKKTKYLFIVGDLVDGIGIYPEQDKELNIKDITKQYDLCAYYISQIRKDIKIIICPGNHDALRLSEPQPVLDKVFAKLLWDIPNVMMVSNPSLINIHKTESFPGFDVLLYHGYSFDYYISNVDTIRKGGGYDRADLIMKFLLNKRHLAPSHSSTLYLPLEYDPLVIDKIPDFFVSGHLHKSSISSYNNISLICSSCWQSKTLFQEKMGHHPEPSRVPIINLKTRAMVLMNFGD